MTCIAFCHDSSLLATGDMSGLVKVWNMETRQEVWSFEVSDLEVCHLYMAVLNFMLYRNYAPIRKGVFLTHELSIQIAQMATHLAYEMQP